MCAFTKTASKERVLLVLANLSILVADAHQRGVAEILDWVANHTRFENVWITLHPARYMHDAVGNIRLSVSNEACSRIKNG